MIFDLSNKGTSPDIEVIFVLSTPFPTLTCCCFQVHGQFQRNDMDQEHSAAPEHDSNNSQAWLENSQIVQNSREN